MASMSSKNSFSLSFHCRKMDSPWKAVWRRALVVWMAMVAIGGQNGEGMAIHKINKIHSAVMSSNSGSIQKRAVPGNVFMDKDVTINRLQRHERNMHERSKRYAPSPNVPNEIPPDYIVVVTLGVAVKSPNRTIDSAVSGLRHAFANFLQWPMENIRVDRISLAGNVISLYFLQTGSVDDFFQTSDLIPAKQVIQPGMLAAIQKEAPKLNITNIFEDHPGHYQELFPLPIWSQPYFPYVIAGAAILLVLLIILIIYICCCRKNDKKEKLEDPPMPTSQQIFYPTIKPDLKDPLTIQPEGSPVYVAKGCMTPIPAQPVRVKAKGLLESRRGSNASLTIDLNPSPELARWDGTPPKESNGTEFLLTAGNRLSRRDLRNSVKHPKALYEEFWEIPSNHTEKVSVAGSGMKNRYKTIIPNEHSRVILPDGERDPLSSYINANYIRGYEGEGRAYIATQGPMAHTIVDFWRLVWYERVPIIVMITKLREKHKNKCENYLPENYGIFGDVEVTVDRVIERNGYEIRHLYLRSHGENRTVIQYWYTAWPDHKPPTSPCQLLELVKEVELRRYKSDGVTPRGPVLVHCSAGIGRTGCFVAASIGIRQLREEHSVDVLGIVCSMRLDRGGMIQTHEQYEFIHQMLCQYEKDLEDPYLTE